LIFKCFILTFPLINGVMTGIMRNGRGQNRSMKIKFKRNGLIFPKAIAQVLAALLIFTVHIFSASGQGTTAFTYQGQLLNNGTSVNGTNVMTFTLYSAATGGTAIATPITNSMPVSNGLFTVNLNFGAAAFNGNACWLDIAVSNDTTNVELSPRMQILPTPYATFAASAASATVAGSASNFVGGSVFAGSFAGNGGGLTNVGVSLQMEVFSNPGEYTFTVPTNVSSVIVEVWGGGGGGGAGNSSDDTAGGGGGAGGYAKGVVSVIPGGGYTVIVGEGGVAGGSGGTSSFDSTLIYATGGLSGGGGSTTSLTAGGAGGSGSGSSSLSITGGRGQYGSTDLGGGSGGNAGAGGPGGLGNLGDGSMAGTAPGGGGGGGAYTGGAGSAGGNGEVIVYY
jgi:hypothetical protein